MVERLPYSEVENTAKHTIRGHHIFNVFGDIERYMYPHTKHIMDKNGIIIPPEDFHLYPEEATLLFNDWADRFIEIFSSPLNDEEDKQYSEDLLGVGYSKKFEYKDAAIGAYQSIFLSLPETPITVNTLPDNICRGCQSTPHGEPGQHCLMNADDISEDLVVVRAIKKVARTYSSKQYVKKSNNIYLQDRKSVVIPVGLLREEEFLSEVVGNTYL